MEQEVIEILSDEESEDEVMRENVKSLPSKKRTLLSSESATGSPSQHWITLDMTIEVQDSDDEHPIAMKAVPMKAVIPATGTAFSDTKGLKQVECGTERIWVSESSITLSVDNLGEAAKDKLGRYIVTQRSRLIWLKIFWRFLHAGQFCQKGSTLHTLLTWIIIRSGRNWIQIVRKNS